MNEKENRSENEILKNKAEKTDLELWIEKKHRLAQPFIPPADLGTELEELLEKYVKGEILPLSSKEVETSFGKKVKVYYPAPKTLNLDNEHRQSAILRNPKRRKMGLKSKFSGKKILSSTVDPVRKCVSVLEKDVNQLNHDIRRLNMLVKYRQENENSENNTEMLTEKWRNVCIEVSDALMSQFKHKFESMFDAQSTTSSSITGTEHNPPSHGFGSKPSLRNLFQSMGLDIDVVGEYDEEDDCFQ